MLEDSESVETLEISKQTPEISQFLAIEFVKYRCVLERTFHHLHLESLQGIVGQIHQNL